MTVGQLKRARSAEARESRRSAILTAAYRLLEERGYQAATMEQVARHARLAKGSVFNYYPSREALFQDLLERLLDDWLIALADDIAKVDRTWDSAKLADMLTTTMAFRPALVALLPLGLKVLEGRRLMRRLFATGSLVEQQLELARPGDGVLLLRYAGALAAGLDWQKDSDELRTALTILFNGFHRKAAGSAGAPR